MRIDNRKYDELRNIKITRNYTKFAEGSVLIEVGDTKVLCTAHIEEGVPKFLKNTGTGWIKAEYSMLPMANSERKNRERGKIDGRTQEIQRFIGRALRSVVDLKKLGERTIWIDCDVIQADGGTRTASISGAYVALVEALHKLYKSGMIKKMPIDKFVSAVSLGVVKDELMLDLCYEEDSNATVDMNVVMTNTGEFIEVQGTGEEKPFSKKQLYLLLELAEIGNKEMIKHQKKVLGEITRDIIGMEYEKNIVVATGNAHKLIEIKSILSDLEFDIHSLKDIELDNIEIIENGRTFEHNAVIKSRTILSALKEKSCTSKEMIVIADDSGLEVDALDLRPGIFTARYAGENATDEENRKKLLEELKDVPFEKRTARFICAIAVVFPDNKSFTVRGVCEGKIALEESGEKGFGYDSLFIPEGYDVTFAQMDSDLKNTISHRAQALRFMRIGLEKNFNK